MDDGGGLKGYLRGWRIWFWGTWLVLLVLLIYFSLSS